MLVRRRRHGRHGPRGLGGLGHLEQYRQGGQFLRERRLVGRQVHGQMENAALQPGADHQPSGMGHPERLGLLPEVEDVDVHGVEAEGQRQLDELAGATGQGQTDGAEVAEHPRGFSWLAAGKGPEVCPTFRRRKSPRRQSRAAFT